MKKLIILGLLAVISGNFLCNSAYAIKTIPDPTGDKVTQPTWYAKETTEVETYKVAEVTEDTEEQIQEEIRLGEMEMLAQLIEAEAGIEDFKGKCLVADVVLNRIDDEAFPNSVEEVIMQYTVRKSDHVKCYQFSTVMDGSFDKAGWYISEDSFKAAQQEYEAQERLDDNILYFTAGSYNPYCTPSYKYGHHYFGY